MGKETETKAKISMHVMYQLYSSSSSKRASYNGLKLYLKLVYLHHNLYSYTLQIQSEGKL